MKSEASSQRDSKKGEALAYVEVVGLSKKFGPLSIIQDLDLTGRATLPIGT